MRKRRKKKICKHCRSTLNEDEVEIFSNECHECYGKYDDVEELDKKEMTIDV